MSWRADRGGTFLAANASYRYTQYALSDVAPGGDDSPSRSLPAASLDSGFVLERAAGTRGERVQTLEPRLLYLYVPYRDQEDLPVFDTGIPDLNLVQLFRDNRYVGPDRVGDANQVSSRRHDPAARCDARPPVPECDARPGVLLRRPARATAR